MIVIPSVKPGESQKEFISRCIPFVIKEGNPKDQAVAICYSIWRRRNKSQMLDELSKMKEDCISIKSMLIKLNETEPLINIKKVKWPPNKKNGSEK